MTTEELAKAIEGKTVLVTPARTSFLVEISHEEAENFRKWQCGAVRLEDVEDDEIIIEAA